MLFLHRAANPFFASTQSTYPALAAGDDDGLVSNRADGHTHNARGQIEGVYHDDPSSERDNQVAMPQTERGVADQQTPQGHVMQPSRLRNEGNAWENV